MEEYNFNLPGNTKLTNDSGVHICHIPDFVFNLKKIQVPFSNMQSMGYLEVFLSRFLYEKDFVANYTVSSIPATLRNFLFPF